MDNYKCTQKAKNSLGIMILCAGLAFIGFFFSQSFEIRITAIAVLIVTIVCMILFHSLTVNVTEKRILLFFGFGLIRKEISMEIIESVRVVQNPWYYGLGIKLIPNGWLYNVAGKDAVELDLKNGQKIRIGTGEPGKLLEAIEAFND